MRADLVVGADGRNSIVRTLAGLEVENLGAPIDVLWFRLSRMPGDPQASMGRFDAGAALMLIDRREYWQCGYVIPKGAADEVRAAGLLAFRARLAGLLPWTAERVAEIGDWEQSPVGGVGINIAIQDAVAAANSLKDKDFSVEKLKAVQARRDLPVRVTQRLQILAQAGS